MRPVAGISIELVALLLVVASIPSISNLSTFGILTVLAEFAATFLIHCPAHYIVGRAVGVKFANIGLGRTTLARVLPSSLRGLARLLPILTLTTDRISLTKIPRSRVAAMYASGTVASISIAFAIAAAVTVLGLQIQAILAWAFALAYLGFDLKYSPRSGDIRRARAALSGSGSGSRSRSRSPSSQDRPIR